MKKEKKKHAILAGIIVIALLISGIRLYWEDYNAYATGNCTIEYGKGECVDGYFKIPFYNSNQQDITRIKITVSSGIRTNITLPADFTVDEPLYPGKTGVLMLFSCKEDADIGGFLMEWCCGGGCYRSSMKWINNEVKIAK
jgi:hypothetical protein